MGRSEFRLRMVFLDSDTVEGQEKWGPPHDLPADDSFGSLLGECMYVLLVQGGMIELQ